jgi:hypothetical protein
LDTVVGLQDEVHRYLRFRHLRRSQRKCTGDWRNLQSVIDHDRARTGKGCANEAGGYSKGLL